jgi:hypothetical protein
MISLSMPLGVVQLLSSEDFDVRIKVELCILNI